MRQRTVFIGVVMMMLAGVALAATPFNGEWKGGSPRGGMSNGRSCGPTYAKVSVKDGKLTAEIQSNTYIYHGKGTVAADGTVTGSWGTSPLKGKFDGKKFAGSYVSAECGVERAIELDRVQ